MKKVVPIVLIVIVAAIGIGAILLNKPAEDTPQTFSKEDVAAHKSESDCWTIISGSVYNITRYVPMHPGGVAEITKICGTDGTSLFNGNPEHTGEAKSQLASLKIGTLN